jgi:excisionase family DNA binding protein
MFTTTIDKLALTHAEAAAALGISERTLWRLKAAGSVPYVQLGKGKRARVLYPRLALLRWLQDRQANTKSARKPTGTPKDGL